MYIRNVKANAVPNKVAIYCLMIFSLYSHKVTTLKNQMKLSLP